MLMVFFFVCDPVAVARRNVRSTCNPRGTVPEEFAELAVEAPQSIICKMATAMCNKPARGSRPVPRRGCGGVAPLNDLVRNLQFAKT